MRIGSDDERVWECVPLFDEDLVSDSAPGAVKVDVVGTGKGFDRAVFLEVFGGFVLDVVVEGEDGLGGVVDFGCAEGFEPTTRKLCQTV